MHAFLHGVDGLDLVVQDDARSSLLVDLVLQHLLLARCGYLLLYAIDLLFGDAWQIVKQCVVLEISPVQLCKLSLHLVPHLVEVALMNMAGDLDGCGEVVLGGTGIG